jgi:hypothetical protein
MISTSPYCRFEDIGVLSVVVPELKFRDVEREIFAAHLMEAPDNAALEDAPEAFNRVGVDCADHVFADSMAASPMREVGRQPRVTAVFVGCEQAHLVRNDFADEGLESLFGDFFENAGDDLALALHRSDNGRLTSRTAAASIAPSMLIDGFPADEGFVHFDDTHELAELLIGQPGADTVAHIPSRFVRAEAEDSIDFQGGDALLAGQHHMNDAEPVAERLIGVLENGAGDMGEPIAVRGAFLALPMPLAGRQIVNRLVSAPGAPDSQGPAVLDQIGAASVLIGKGLFPLCDRHLVYALVFLSYFRLQVQYERSLPC